MKQFDNSAVVISSLIHITSNYSNHTGKLFAPGKCGQMVSKREWMIRTFCQKATLFDLQDSNEERESHV